MITADTPGPDGDASERLLRDDRLLSNEAAVLHPFPGTGCAAVRCIAVDVRLTDSGGLSLVFRLDGRLEDILIPAPQPAAFRDGLSKHTCFEAFVAIREEPAYFEFNFSPSGEWAAYRFSSYRRREAHAACTAPKIALRRESQSLQLSAMIDRKSLPAPPASGAPVELGLSAVIETAGGSCSYYALAHPAPRPDFHDRAGFILTVSP